MHHSRWVCFVVWSCVRRFSTSCPSDQAMLNADIFHRYAMRSASWPHLFFCHHQMLKKVWKVFCIDTWEESRDNQAYRECTGADWSGERVQVVKANATHLHEKQGESFVCSWKIISKDQRNNRQGKQPEESLKLWLKGALPNNLPVLGNTLKQKAETLGVRWK